MGSTSIRKALSPLTLCAGLQRTHILMLLFPLIVATFAAAERPELGSSIPAPSPQPAVERPCGGPGQRCCPDNTTVDTATSPEGNADAATEDRSPCFRRTDCADGVCQNCGDEGEKCCAGGTCGIAGFGAPLTCNANNICVVNCGVNGAACCTDAEFTALVEAYEDGLYSFLYGTDRFPSDVAAADEALGSVGGCFAGTQCDVRGVCTPRASGSETHPDYLYTVNYLDYGACGNPGTACCPEFVDVQGPAAAQDDTYDIICSGNVDGSDPRAMCIGGFCASCGTAGAACCPGGRCSDNFFFGLKCTGDSEGVCEIVCGEIGLQCCPEDFSARESSEVIPCADTFATCIDGICTLCGEFNRTCCPLPVPSTSTGLSNTTGPAVSADVGISSDHSYDYSYYNPEDFRCSGYSSFCDAETITCQATCGVEGSPCCDSDVNLYYSYYESDLNLCAFPAQCGESGMCRVCGFDGLECCTADPMGDAQARGDDPCFGEGSRCEDGVCVGALQGVVECGLYGDYCCEGGPECVQHNVCIDGRCQDCGLENAPCCTGGTCARDGKCMKGVCGTPQCGDVGQPCCGSGENLCGEGNGALCSEGTCVACGELDEPCCQPDAGYTFQECYVSRSAEYEGRYFPKDLECSPDGTCVRATDNGVDDPVPPPLPSPETEADQPNRPRPQTSRRPRMPPGPRRTRRTRTSRGGRVLGEPPERRNRKPRAARSVPAAVASSVPPPPQ